jgi:hypothetical protein
MYQRSTLTHLDGPQSNPCPQIQYPLRMFLNGGKYHPTTKTSLDQIMIPQEAILLRDIVRQPIPFLRQSCNDTHGNVSHFEETFMFDIKTPPSMT